MSWAGGSRPETYGSWKTKLENVVELRELKIHLDYWIAQQSDGTVVLKGGRDYEQFVEYLERLFEQQRQQNFNEAAKAIAIASTKNYAIVFDNQIGERANEKS